MNDITYCYGLQRQLIYREQDHEGVIEIVDDLLTRNLHFGNASRQSSMLLKEPHVLALDYTKVMLLIFLFAPKPPQRVLIAGLGGGSIAKFFLHHFAHCQVEVIECRPKMVEIARKYFALPNVERLKIHLADATKMIPKLPAKSYDTIVVDIFHAEGIPKSATSRAFFNACRRAMRPGGVGFFNIWDNNIKTYEEILKTIQHSFFERAYIAPVPHVGNCVVFTFTRPLPWQMLFKNIPQELIQIEKKYQYQLPRTKEIPPSKARLIPLCL